MGRIAHNLSNIVSKDDAMLYRVTIRRAGSVIDHVEIQAQSALEAINQVDAPFEKLPVVISLRYGELTTVHWSGYEYEARRLGKPNEDR